VDGAKLSEEDRAHWRKQAREWLRLDLAARAKKLDAGTAADRVGVQKALSQWRACPDLAGLRDPDALDKLSPDERQECRALWRDLDALLERAEAPK
jgi:hypothetical protein